MLKVRVDYLHGLQELTLDNLRDSAASGGGTIVGGAALCGFGIFHRNACNGRG